jgi:outer membrane lipoprotein-sorting protein
MTARLRHVFRVLLADGARSPGPAAPVKLGALALVAILGSSSIAAADGPAASDAGATAPAPARERIEGEKLDGALGEIARARKELRTLRASFTQERKITLLATTVKSKGELTFATPDRLRWDLAPPDDIAYFVGPEGLAYRTKTGGASIPASGANIGKALVDLRALLGGDLNALRERYVLGGSRSPADVEITGVAKDPKASVRAFTLVLDKNLVAPLRAKLAEGKTDTIDIVFSNVVVNGPIDPARLRP